LIQFSHLLEGKNYTTSPLKRRTDESNYDVYNSYFDEIILPNLKKSTTNKSNDLINSRRVLELPKLETSDSYLNKLRLAFQKYSDFIDIIIFGSYADKTTTNFSDYDILVILDDSQLFNKEVWTQLLNINACIQKFDVLQHHGLFLTNKKSFKSYDNNSIPIKTLEDGNSLFRDSKFTVNFHTNNKLIDKNVYDNLEAIDLLILEDSKKYHLFNLKRLMGSIFIQPAYYYQSKGDEITKKEALYKFAKEFKVQNELQVLSQLRYDWPFKKRLELVSHLYTYLNYPFRKQFEILTTKLPIYTEVDKNTRDSIFKMYKIFKELC
jgi:predicted nucleotidyltransferase